MKITSYSSATHRPRSHHAPLPLLTASSFSTDAPERSASPSVTSPSHRFISHIVAQPAHRECHRRGRTTGARKCDQSLPFLPSRPSGRAHGHAVLKWAASRNRPLCVISSGETTVRVTGAGRGGRNQEFALAIADVLRSTDAVVVSASVGTDGIDGPTDAAGAIADSTTMERARQRGLDPRDFLARNDSYTSFCAMVH